MAFNNYVNNRFNYLVSVLKKRQEGFIYLYGCGKHSEELLEVLKNNNIKIDGLIDRDESDLLNKSIYGYNVYNIDKIAGNSGKKVVVISSFEFQQVIYERIKRYENDELMIIKIYDELNDYKNSLEDKEYQRWVSEEGEKKRYRYDLNENSIVFDLGGYKGEWTKEIFSKYNSKVYVFEPVIEYCDDMKKVFCDNSKINVCNFALGKNNCDESIYLDSDGSSIYNKHGNKEKIKIRNIKDFIIDNNIKHVDLMKINIEGAEYDLLEYMIEEKITNIVGNIQVQFHSFVDNAEERMEFIQSELRKTHYLTYQYKFVFENWCKIKK